MFDAPLKVKTLLNGLAKAVNEAIATTAKHLGIGLQQAKLNVMEYKVDREFGKGASKKEHHGHFDAHRAGEEPCNSFIAALCVGGQRKLSTAVGARRDFEEVDLPKVPHTGTFQVAPIDRRVVHRLVCILRVLRMHQGHCAISPHGRNQSRAACSTA